MIFISKIVVHGPPLGNGAFFGPEAQFKTKHPVCITNKVMIWEGKFPTEPNFSVLSSISKPLRDHEELRGIYPFVSVKTTYLLKSLTGHRTTYICYREDQYNLYYNHLQICEISFELLAHGLSCGCR